METDPVSETLCFSLLFRKNSDDGQSPKIQYTTGSVLSRHARGRKMCDRTVQDVKDRMLASPKKSLRRLSQETCQRAAKEAKLHPYNVFLA
jgi:hypothetical protein